jgi:hypothetical protein
LATTDSKSVATSSAARAGTASPVVTEPAAA